jgi:hypothetical protein
MAESLRVRRGYPYLDSPFVGEVINLFKVTAHVGIAECCSVAFKTRIRRIGNLVEAQWSDVCIANNPLTDVVDAMPKVLVEGFPRDESLPIVGFKSLTDCVLYTSARSN